MKAYVSICYYIAGFFLEWELLQPKLVRKSKHNSMISNVFFRNLNNLWNNVEKSDRSRQATAGSVSALSWNFHVGYVWQEYRHTLITFNIYCLVMDCFLLISWNVLLRYTNWETAQRLVCHHDPFSQIVSLRKSISKPTIFSYFVLFYYPCNI